MQRDIYIHMYIWIYSHRKIHGCMYVCKAGCAVAAGLQAIGNPRGTSRHVLVRPLAFHAQFCTSLPPIYSLSVCLAAAYSLAGLYTPFAHVKPYFYTRRGALRACTEQRVDRAGCPQTRASALVIQIRVYVRSRTLLNFPTA